MLFPESPRIERARRQAHVTPAAVIMKMLFFSADQNEVQQVGESFKEAGIPCEIRQTPCPRKAKFHSPEAELWIKDDRDCHRALMLCVQLGIGFARRPYVASIFDIDQEPEEEESPTPSHVMTGTS